MKKTTVLTGAAFIAATAGVAMGDTFTDSGSFMAALEAGAYTNTFDDSGSGPFASLSYSNGTFSYDITAMGAGGSGLFNDPGLVSTDSALDGILITFTSGNVTGVGANFYASDINFLPLSADMTLSLSDGTIEAFSASSAADFRGFTSNVAITSIFIDADDSFTNAWSTLDNLTVGRAIPTPGSLAMLGLGGLVATRRRR